jgi:hypothetical protein
VKQGIKGRETFGQAGWHGQETVPQQGVALVSLALIWSHEAETWEAATTVYLLTISVGSAGSSLITVVLNKSFAKKNC